MMSSHNEEQNASSLFGDTGADDPFNQLQQQDLTLNSQQQQQPAKPEQPQSAKTDEHNEQRTTGQPTGEHGDASGLFGNDNAESADMLFGAPSNNHDVFNSLGQPSTAQQHNASAANFFDQGQASDSFFDNLTGSTNTAAAASLPGQTDAYSQHQLQEQTQEPLNAMSSLTQAYDPNTYGYDYNQQDLQQQQQIDPSQWIQFDPNVHYFYDEQGQVQYYDPNTNQVYDMSQYGYDQQQAYQYDPQYANYYGQQQQEVNDPNAYTDQQQQQQYDPNTYADQQQQQQYDPNTYADQQQQQQQQQYNPSAYADQQQQQHANDSNAYADQQQQQQYDPNAYATTQQQHVYDNAYAAQQSQAEQTEQYQNYDPNAYAQTQQSQNYNYDINASLEQPQAETSFEDITKQAEQLDFDFGTSQGSQQQPDQSEKEEEQQQVTLTAVPTSSPPPAQQHVGQQGEPVTLSAVELSSPPIQQQSNQLEEEEQVTLSAVPSSSPPPPQPSAQQQPLHQQPEQPKEPEPATATSPTASYYGYTPLERSSTMNSSHTFSEMDNRRFSASPFSVAGSAAGAGVANGPGAATGGYPYPMERSATVPPPMMDRMSSPRPTLVPCPDPNCEGENKPKAKFCCECGRPLAGISRSTTPSVAAVAGAVPVGMSSNNVSGMEPINPISLGQVAEQVRKSALEDKKDMFKESLKKFAEHSVIVQSELEVDEKRKRALEYMTDRMDKFEDASKVLLWRVVKLMIEHSDCTLGDGGALDKAIIAEILPQRNVEQEKKVEIPDSNVVDSPLNTAEEKKEITKDLTVVEETAVVLKDSQENKDVEPSESSEKGAEEKNEKTNEEASDKDSALDDDATKQDDIIDSTNKIAEEVTDTKTSGGSTVDQSSSEAKTDEIDELEKLLLQGNRESACSYASKKNMWAHAFSIASSNSDLLKRTVTRFIKQELYAATTESIQYSTFKHPQLRMLYSVFAGNSTDAVMDFVKQKEDGAPSYSSEAVDGWKRALGLILANRSNDDQTVISALGDQLQQSGAKDNDARLCYLLSPDVSALDNRKIVGKNLYADLESLYLAELYEFATKANVRQDFKLILAWWLSEFGMKDESQKYCDSIVHYLGTATDADSLLESLKQLGDITNVSIESESATAFLNKETFDSLISSVESSYNNNRYTANNAHSSGYGYEAQATGYGEPYDYAGQVVYQQDDTLQQNNYSYGYGYTAPNNEAGNSNDVATGSSSAVAGAAPPVSKAIQSPFQNTTQAQPITSPLQQSNVKPVSSPFGMQQQPQNAVRSPFMQQQQQTPASSYQPYQPDYPADQNQQSNGGAWWNSEAMQENIEDLQAGNNITAATANIYEPSNHMSYQPDAYTPAPTATTTQEQTGGIGGFDDDDDLGFGNNSTKKVAAPATEKAADKSTDKDTTNEENDMKAADNKKDKEQKEKSSWGLFSIFGGGKKEKDISDDKKPVKANLGEQSTFYYDEKEKRWVNKLNDNKPAAAPLPPPPKASTPQPPTASPMAPPPGHAKPSSMPPSRSQSALSAPPGAAGGPPGAVPPPSFSTPPGGRRAGGARKPMRSRYVDVLNSQS